MSLNRFSFTHRELLDNINLLSHALGDVGVEIPYFQIEGMCHGFAKTYLLYASTGRRDKFFSLILFLAKLNKNKIDNLVNKHYQEIIQIRKDYTNHPSTNDTLNFTEIIKFLLEIYLAQINEDYSMFNVWLRNFSFICNTKNLASNLKLARLAEGEFMEIANGFHAFALEKVTNGFYLFDINNVEEKKLLRNEEDVACKLINYLNKVNLLLNPNNDDERLGFSIRFLSNKNHHQQLDNLLNYALQANELNPDDKSLILQLQQHRISIADLVLTLRSKIECLSKLKQQFKELNKEFRNFIDHLKLNGDQSSINKLLEENKLCLNDKAYRFNVTWLELAVGANQYTLVHQLLHNGADPNVILTSMGSTPLWSAARNGYTQITQELLKYHANPNLTQIPQGITPLWITCQNGNLNIVNVLIQAGANINCISDKGFTPLTIAAENGHLEVVNALLAQHANPNLTGFTNITPLLMAAQNGHPDIVEKLLLDNADPNLEARSGWNPLLIAVQRGYIDITKKLLAHRADPNYKDKLGNTPLGIAIKNENLDMKQLLLQSGAKPNLGVKTKRTLSMFHKYDTRLQSKKYRKLDTGTKYSLT